MSAIHRVFIAALVLALGFGSAGCTVVPSPVSGFIFTNVSYPMAELDQTNEAQSSKTGTANAFSLFGLLAIGDASLAAAQKDGNIQKIHHVDIRATSVLGIFANYQIIVYGE